jgi:hypothetical protein
MANESYKFPDEVEVTTDEADDGLKIEIVDDTPEEDKGRKPLPKEIVEELEKDDLEDYSEKVKKRLSQMKKVWHDERREKERHSREREEAIRFAQVQAEENKKLKQQLGYGQKMYMQQATRTAEADIEAAKAQLKRAYEEADADKLTEAQEALTDAKLKLKEYQRYTPSLQEEEEGVQQAQQTRQQTITVDPKAEAWRQRNSWWGVDKEMTALALGLHDRLVNDGVDPRSDDYYKAIDKTIRKRFPENFEEDNAEQEKPAPRKASTVVAPATRSSAPKQVRLSASAVAIAKKLGVSPEHYAREVMKLENNNG